MFMHLRARHSAEKCELEGQPVDRTANKTRSGLRSAHGRRIFYRHIGRVLERGKFHLGFLDDRLSMRHSAIFKVASVRGAITIAFLERLEKLVGEIEGRPTLLGDWF
jgi:hypothetical protein